jgi:hypothetical protein
MYAFQPCANRHLPFSHGQSEQEDPGSSKATDVGGKLALEA